MLTKQPLCAGLFGRALSLEPRSEDVYFHFAKYQDQLMQDARQRQDAKAAQQPLNPKDVRSKGMDRIGGKARSAASHFSGKTLN